MQITAVAAEIESPWPSETLKVKDVYAPTEAVHVLPLDAIVYAYGEAARYVRLEVRAP